MQYYTIIKWLWNFKTCAHETHLLQMLCSLVGTHPTAEKNWISLQRKKFARTGSNNLKKKIQAFNISILSTEDVGDRISVLIARVICI